MGPRLRQQTCHELQDGDGETCRSVGQNRRQEFHRLQEWVMAYTQIRPSPLRSAHGLVEGADRFIVSLSGIGAEIQLLYRPEEIEGGRSRIQNRANSQPGL